MLILLHFGFVSHSIIPCNYWIYTLYWVCINKHSTLQMRNANRLLFAFVHISAAFEAKIFFSFHFITILCDLCSRLALQKKSRWLRTIKIQVEILLATPWLMLYTSWYVINRLFCRANPSGIFHVNDNKWMYKKYIYVCMITIIPSIIIFNSIYSHSIKQPISDILKFKFFQWILSNVYFSFIHLYVKWHWWFIQVN